MKKALIIAIIFISPYISLGQIVLDQTDLPQIGDVQIFNSLDSTVSSTVSPGPSGANQVWNFGTLPGNLDTNYYVAPASTPNGSSFPGANIAIRITEQSFNHYEYHINGPTGMKLYGVDDPPPILLDIDPFEFPLLTYGNSVNHALRARFNIVNANTYDAFYLDLTSTADAWGTITTPAGTVNAIRIYTTETTYDSSYVSGTGTQNSVVTGHYYYKWYAKNLGWPVMQIAWGNLAEPNFKTVRYAHDLSSVTGIKSLESNDGIVIYPNPFSAHTTLKAVSPFNNATLIVYNSFGQEVKQLNNISGQSITLHRNDLPSGLYFIRVMQDNKIFVTDKLVITD